MPLKSKPKVERPVVLRSKDYFRLCGEPFTPEEIAVKDVHRKPFEGKYEKSVRLKLNQPLTATKGPIDIRLSNPDGSTTAIEVKCVETTELDAAGDYRLSGELRLGKSLEDEIVGRVIVIVGNATILADDEDELLSEDSVVFKRCIQGAFRSKDFKELPLATRLKINELLRPSHAMAHVDMMVLCGHDRSIWIPKKDFDIAFTFTSASQSRLSYKLDWNYLRNRLESNHDNQKERDNVMRMLHSEDRSEHSSHPASETVSGS